MILKYIPLIALFYYAPSVFGGGADIFSNTEGKIITLYRENTHKLKYKNKSQNTNNKLTRKPDTTKRIAKTTQQITQ